MTRFISMRQLKDLVGLSKTTIYKRISSGAFPRAVPLGPKRVVFIEAEIEAWMRKQIRLGRNEVHSSTARQARAVKAVDPQSSVPEASVWERRPLVIDHQGRTFSKLKGNRRD